MGRELKKCIVPGCNNNGRSLGIRGNRKFYSSRCRKHRKVRVESIEDAPK